MKLLKQEKNLKPIVRLGDKHICPIHGPNIVASVASTSTCQGQPVATVGDVTSCGATIITGSSVSTIDGKPTAIIGSKTSHGGTIVSGATTFTA